MLVEVGAGNTWSPPPHAGFQLFSRIKLAAPIALVAGQ